MDCGRLQQILGAGARKGIVVAGDVMLDRFIYGRVSRISPEAPVPVVEVTHETSHPGGAANVARNLPLFCGRVELCGVTGADAGARELRALLEAEGVGQKLLIEAEGMVTTVKTRVIARQQQVVRVDRERRRPPEKHVWEQALKELAALRQEVDALIFEDYGKGFLGDWFVAGVKEIFQGTRTALLVDPNPGNPLDWSGMTAVKPNRGEAFAAAGLPWREPHPEPLEDQPLREACLRLMERWRPEYLLVTLGEQGMLLFPLEGEPRHIPSRAREVYDVSGAGDTAIALFAVALAAGADGLEAAQVSNLAGGVVVGKLGTAKILPEELLVACRNAEG